MAGGPEIGLEIVMSARACVTVASKAPNKAIAIIFSRPCFRVMSRLCPILSRFRGDHRIVCDYVSSGDHSIT